MAPESIAPFSPPFAAVADRRVRRLLSALFHTEQQVSTLVGSAAAPTNPNGWRPANHLNNQQDSTAERSNPSPWTAIVEHARYVGPYLVDLCAARQLDVKNGKRFASSSSRVSSLSAADVLRRERQPIHVRPKGWKPRK